MPSRYFYTIKNIIAAFKTQMRTFLHHVALSFALSFLAKPSIEEKDKVKA